MTCTKCHKPMLDCDCPTALERLKWLISPESPMFFNESQLRRYRRRIEELEGHQELQNL